MHVDRKLSFPSPWRVVVAVGDGAAILLFAAAGRAAHAEHSDPAMHTVGVALPFLVGWFAAAIPVGAYRLPSLLSLRAAISRTAAGWLVGGAVGLIIRSLAERRLVPITFVFVALSFGLLFLLLWRMAVVALGRRLRR